jgi:bifunctional UDP-N-acetylglucosamine pyrophosphorylase/glucosamine-1-phosphate N-acetyltransferase
MGPAPLCRPKLLLIFFGRKQELHMKVTAVLLAAGQGTRMKTDLPKVLHPVCGKPMLAYAYEAACSASTGKPLIVVGKDAEPIRNFLGDKASYIQQDPQLMRICRLYVLRP